MSGDRFRLHLPVASSVPLGALFGIADAYVDRLAGLTVLCNCAGLSGAGRKAAVLGLEQDGGAAASMQLLTAGSVFLRTIQTTDEHGRSKPGPFKFSGGLHRALRPFCAGHVGRVFSLAAILRMSNGVLPDVLHTGGGWCCGHVWLEVDLDTAGAVDSGNFQSDLERADWEAVGGAALEHDTKRLCPGPSNWRDGIK